VKHYPSDTNRIDGVPRPTGEYYNGKRVYVVEIDVGSLPNNTTKSVTHNLSIDTVTDTELHATDGTTTLTT